jgi:hypothetical protein
MEKQNRTCLRASVFATVAVVSVGLIAGCPFLPPGPPAAAVLEGTWSITPTEPGDCTDCTYEAEFDANGNLIQLRATRADGATATLTTTDASTQLDGSDVVITVPDPTGARVFEGTLSDDENTMTGSITQEIDLGDLEITLPGGELTFDRLVVDPCEGVTCDPGETCVDGVCVPVDPCEGVTCDPGEVCEDGVCVPEDACAGVTCATCETCVEGVCEPLVGDPVVGAAFYTDNGCNACHGDDASGGFGPGLVGEECAELYDVMSGNVTHTGGAVADVTEQDAADLEAWLGSL